MSSTVTARMLDLLESSASKTPYPNSPYGVRDAFDAGLVLSNLSFGNPRRLIEAEIDRMHYLVRKPELRDEGEKLIALMKDVSASWKEILNLATSIAEKATGEKLS